MPVTPGASRVTSTAASKRSSNVGPLSEPLARAVPRSRLLGRAAFAVVFFGLELGGILWGQRAPDHALGFQMFNESSRLTIRLFREIKKKNRRVRVPVVDGAWSAPDHAGHTRTYVWRERVRAFPLYLLDQSNHAPYGLDAQLFRLQAALDDFVAHTPEDAATLALIAEVEPVKNGRPEPLVTLRSDKR